MPRQYRMICCVLSAMIVSSCATDEPRTAAQSREIVEEQMRQETGPTERVALGQPVIRAEVLTVQQGTTAELVEGTVHVTRRGEATGLEGLQEVEQDDLLQLSEGSAVRLRAPDRSEFVLTPRHGEWFRFDVSEK